MKVLADFCAAVFSFLSSLINESLNVRVKNHKPQSGNTNPLPTPGPHLRRVLVFAAKAGNNEPQSAGFKTPRLV
jgi:hypothetical protein